VAAIFPVRRLQSSASGIWRVAVVVPAHNEELSIASCVASLLSAGKDDIDVSVYVIADNCSDNTSAVSRQAGAMVLERQSETERGKGHALHFAFTELERIGFDCVLVVDADTIVAPNFLVAAAGALRAGSDAVQVRYVARNASDNMRTRLMSLALRAFNVIRPRGRQNLNLSAGILGNGFGLRRETLTAVPYHAASVVEDLEYHLSLVRSGRRVMFVDDTAVYGEMPVRGQGVETQRSRWEGGRLRMIREQIPRLLRDVLSGKLRCLEPLLELLLLPLAFHFTLLLCASLSPNIYIRSIGLFGFVVLAIHLLATAFVCGQGFSDLKALAAAPFYIVWKILLIPSLFRNARAKNAWVRTSRNSEHGID
jgi:cellulose synthase/poly-beta-1,6-N-acetylglucosamine synthase-like glycosyltransferase